MNGEVVTWDRILSASVSVPAVPLTVHTFGIDTDDVEWCISEPVVCLLAEVVETYRRFLKSAHDLGLPKSPPSPESLAQEGYQFDYQETRVRYLLNDTEHGTPEPLDAGDCRFARIIVLPTGEPVPAEWLADRAKDFRDYAAERAAERGEGDTSDQGAK